MTKLDIVTTYIMVGNNDKIQSVVVPQNLPQIILQTEMGLISISSRVPNFLSSEKLFMVIAGTKKINIQGVRRKKFPKSEKP